MSRHSWYCCFALMAAPLSHSVAAVVSGIVKDVSTPPVHDASVLLISPERIWQMKTGAGGRFEFRNIPAGQYELRATANAFKDGVSSLQIGDQNPAPVSVVLNLGSVPDMRYCGVRTDISYTAFDPKNSRLRGTLLQYENGKPLKGAEIALWREEERKPAYRTKSDAFGGFSLAAAPGRYSLRISQWAYHEWKEDLLLPPGNAVYVKTSLLERNRIVVCQ